MDCWNCNTEMIWGGDHDMEDAESFVMVSNFSCPECESQADFYTSNKDLVEHPPVAFIEGSSETQH